MTTGRRTCALISVGDENYWQSCRSITNGLREVYLSRHQEFWRCTEWRLSNLTSLQGMAQIAQEILALAPDEIVFLDTSPLYGSLLSAFRLQLERQTFAGVVRFHVYGDFTLRAYQWISWTPSLKGLRVEWACASEAQRRMVESLLTTAENATWLCPFPVDSEKFVFDLSLRDRTRKSLGLKKNDIAILYAGRLSLQKNVLASVRAFSALPTDVLMRAHLIFAGEFDDLGAPFSDVSLPGGGFFHLWNQELERLPENVRGRIHLIRGLPQEKLQGLYSAADLFLSLSLQHDEDFGMAAAEAAIAGLPLVLTRWGGYEGFRELGLDIAGIDVEIESRGPLFDQPSVTRLIEKKIKEILREENREDLRQRRGRQARAFFSPATLRQKIHQRHQNDLPQGRRLPPSFNGFHSNMTSLAEFFHAPSGRLIFSDCQKGSVYEQVYRHYIAQPNIATRDLRYEAVSVGG